MQAASDADQTSTRTPSLAYVCFLGAHNQLITPAVQRCSAGNQTAASRATGDEAEAALAVLAAIIGELTVRSSRADDVSLALSRDARRALTVLGNAADSSSGGAVGSGESQPRALLHEMHKMAAAAAGAEVRAARAVRARDVLISRVSALKDELACVFVCVCVRCCGDVFDCVL